jgi:hypothetical protein
MKNLILIFFAVVLFSSCTTMSGKYTAYSANSPEGQSIENYKNGNSYLIVKNKTGKSKIITVKYLFPESSEVNYTVPANGKDKIKLHRGVAVINDNMNDPIKLSIDPYFEYRINIKSKTK